MPAQRRIRAPRQRRVDRHIDAPERAHTHTTRVQWGTAMDVPEPAEAIPEPISIVRCRELLGDDEAEALSDDEVLDVGRHAEAMAQVLIALALQDGRVH